MALEVEDWATAFLSIPLPSTDFLGSFSHEENDDIDFQSIFADIDSTMIPNPNNPDDSSDSKKTTSETVSGEAKKMEEEELKYYKGSDQDLSSFSPENPSPNPTRTYMDANELIPRSRTPVSYESHLSGLGTSFDPLVIDDDDDEGCNGTIPSFNPKPSDFKNSTTSVNVGNTAIGISEPESVSSEAKKMEEEKLKDFKGYEDYDYQDWSSFFPENPNPNPKRACMGVNEQPVSGQRYLSGLGTSFNPLVIDDDDEIRRLGYDDATALGAKRKRLLSNWNEGFQMAWLEGFDIGLLHWL